jgi:AraC-like DNA-binding protein
VTVTAHTARDLLQPANLNIADLRDGAPVRAGTYLYRGVDRVSSWHSHDLHQIEYAIQGVAEVETAAGHHLLPPQRAIWIPAGLRHRTTLSGVLSLAVFFDPAMIGDTGGDARVLAAPPVLREMMIYAARWPITRTDPDPTADVFFDALARLTLEWLDHDVPLHLPTSDDPILEAVMAHTQDHLSDVTTRQVCAAVGISERTLRRRFPATGMTWGRYLLTSRMMRAMAMLADPDRTVMSVATEVGYDSMSAFTRSFRSFSGELPSVYRARASHGDRRVGPAAEGGDHTEATKEYP